MAAATACATSCPTSSACRRRICWCGRPASTTTPGCWSCEWPARTGTPLLHELGQRPVADGNERKARQRAFCGWMLERYGVWPANASYLYPYFNYDEALAEFRGRALALPALHARPAAALAAVRGDGGGARSDRSRRLDASHQRRARRHRRAGDAGHRHEHPAGVPRQHRQPGRDRQSAGGRHRRGAGADRRQRRAHRSAWATCRRTSSASCTG